MEEERDAVPLIRGVWFGHLAEALDDEPSIRECLGIVTKRPVLPVERHRVSIMVRASCENPAVKP